MGSIKPHVSNLHVRVWLIALYFFSPPTQRSPCGIYTRDHTRIDLSYMVTSRLAGNCGQILAKSLIIELRSSIDAVDINNLGIIHYLNIIR